MDEGVGLTQYQRSFLHSRVCTLPPLAALKHLWSSIITVLITEANLRFKMCSYSFKERYKKHRGGLRTMQLRKRSGGKKWRKADSCEADWCSLITATLPSWAPGAVIEFFTHAGKKRRSSLRTDKRTWCWQPDWITAACLCEQYQLVTDCLPHSLSLCLLLCLTRSKQWIFSMQCLLVSVWLYSPGLTH